MSTNNIGFYEEMTKFIFQLSSNIIKSHLFCSYEQGLARDEISDSEARETSYEPHCEKTGLRGFRPAYM